MLSCSIPITRRWALDSRDPCAASLPGPRWRKSSPIAPMSTRGWRISGGSPPSARAMNLVELGCHHEQQHQELLLTDILHLFAQNPLGPVYRHDDVVNGSAPSPAGGVNYAGGLVEIGAAPEGFAFDCERPRHRVFIAPFRLADRLVSNARMDGFRRRRRLSAPPAVAVGRLGAVLRRRIGRRPIIGKSATAAFGP